MNTDFIHNIEGQLTLWAKNKQTVRAIVEIGSQARKDHPADEWSDLDIVLVVSGPIGPDETRTWLKEISLWVDDTWCISNELDDISSWFSLGNMIVGRLKTDFAVLVISNETVEEQSLEEILPTTTFAYVFYPICKVIYDQEGKPREIIQKCGKYSPRIPTAEAFTNFARQSWIDLIHIAQIYKRGEYYRASLLLNEHKSRYLLRLVEWHTLIFGDGEKIWPRGRFLEDWAASYVVQELREINENYIGKGFWDSFHKVIALHQYIAHEIEINNGYLISNDEEDKFQRWLSDICS